MTDFIEALNRYREERQSIYALLNNIDRIVEHNKENPMRLLAELSQENTKKPLSPEDVKCIKNRIVSVAKLQNNKEMDLIELDDTVEINPSDNTVELDDVYSTEEVNESGFEDVIENPIAPNNNRGISQVPQNSRKTGVYSVLHRQRKTNRTGHEGRMLNDRYILEKRLGFGGMGMVYRAVDLNKLKSGFGDPYVALKIMRHGVDTSQNWFQNLQKEVKRSQQLIHPNIVDIHEIKRDQNIVYQNIVYLVMEYLPGKTLREKIRASDFEGLPFIEALPIIHGMGEALAFAHDHGIVHYDFKPSNVIITDDRQIKVIDFGIARAYKSETHDDRLRPDSIVLTPAYASPEMLERQPPDPRDDIYALGTTVYELLTGNHPFDRKPATQARDARLQPQQPEGLTTVQWVALKETLSFERRDRTLNVRDFLESLNSRGHSKKANASLLKGAVAATVISIMATSSYLSVVDNDIRELFDSLVSSIGFAAKDIALEKARVPPSADKVDITETDARASDLSQQSDENSDFAAIGEKNPENR